MEDQGRQEIAKKRKQGSRHKHERKENEYPIL
jgi:hypothetical protein